jgi:hypothetical protein
MSELDRGRLAKLLGMAGSAFEAEALAAVRKAYELIRAAGLSWADLLAPYDELQVAITAARQLLDENAALQSELAQYRDIISVQRDDDWHSVGNHRDQARWALDLADRGLLRLNQFERSFLVTVTRWRGALTGKQQPIWADMLPEIARRSGRVPP